MSTSTFRKGDIVKFSKPQKGEHDLHFTLLDEPAGEIYGKKQPTFVGIRGSFLLGFITGFFSEGTSE